MENVGIDFLKSRGQGCDGASAINGINGGVQKWMKDIIKCPVPFVYCAARVICEKYSNGFKDELKSKMRSFATEFRREISVTETVLEVKKSHAPERH